MLALIECTSSIATSCNHDQASLLLSSSVLWHALEAEPGDRSLKVWGQFHAVDLDGNVM